MISCRIFLLPDLIQGLLHHYVGISCIVVDVRVVSIQSQTFRCKLQELLVHRVWCGADTLPSDKQYNLQMMRELYQAGSAFEEALIYDVIQESPETVECTMNTFLCSCLYLLFDAKGRFH